MGAPGGLSARPVIRLATVADSVPLGAIHVAAWREAYAGLLPASRLAALDARERAAMWQGAIASGTARGVYVAEDRGVMIGFGACGHQRTPSLIGLGFSGEVTALYVLRAGQRRGAGRLLMRAMARRLIAEGERSLGLWVLRDNLPARRFYERLEGVVIASRGDWAATGEEAETAYGWRDLTRLMAT
ncbi:MAG: hypothetical protein B7Y45_12995 [Sphingomonas sp. 28-66-16]|nr:MAG: hypothetical protein B7Y45_12995 [Sphingomonas sp. 28-66-16]